MLRKTPNSLAMTFKGQAYILPCLEGENPPRVAMGAVAKGYNATLSHIQAMQRAAARRTDRRRKAASARIRAMGGAEKWSLIARGKAGNNRSKGTT